MKFSVCRVLHIFKEHSKCHRKLVKVPKGIAILRNLSVALENRAAMTFRIAIFCRSQVRLRTNLTSCLKPNVGITIKKHSPVIKSWVVYDIFIATLYVDPAGCREPFVHTGRSCKNQLQGPVCRSTACLHKPNSQASHDCTISGARPTTCTDMN